jgi:hypothetical protein
MNELTYLRVEDGRLICSTESGAEFALPITDQLRQAVREQTAAEIPDVVIQIPEVLRPKDIQSLVRAGATAEELAAASGLDLVHVNRYALPVMDERAFVADRARDLPPSHDSGAPTLSALAEARLEERGVDATSLAWDAVRQAQGWVVRLDFESSEGPARARWRVDLASATLSPLDEQARWITAATEPDAPIPPMRLLSPLPGGAQEDDADGPDSPLSLLDGLMDARGLRDPALPGDSVDQLSDRADVLELRRGEDEATGALSYLEPEPLDSIGNPITFLQDTDEEAAEPGPLPEPLMPPAPLPTYEPSWLAAPVSAGEPGGASEPGPDAAAEWAGDTGPVADAATEAPLEAPRPRRDSIWDAPAREPVEPPPAPDRASIWTRTAPGFETQGELFQAAPVGQADYPRTTPLAASPKTESAADPAPGSGDQDGNPPEDQATRPATRSRSAAKRSSVPSWDEIVFGAARTDT